MIDKTRVPATYAVRWKIERGPGPDGSEVVGLTFENLGGEAIRVILHPKGAALFASEMAADVSAANDR